MTSNFECRTPEDTAALARRLADRLCGGECIAFTGGMGAGKTTFVRALAEALGYRGEVSSPTFAIVQEYRGGRLPVFHFDMYRVESWDDLYTTSFFEYLDAGGVTAIEWSENIEAALPDYCIRIAISREEDSRRFVIDGITL